MAGPPYPTYNESADIFSKNKTIVNADPIKHQAIMTAPVQNPDGSW